jgi:hypothetical protein
LLFFLVGKYKNPDFLSAAIADTILIITSILLFGIWGLQTPLIFSG